MCVHPKLKRRNKIFSTSRNIPTFRESNSSLANIYSSLVLATMKKTYIYYEQVLQKASMYVSLVSKTFCLCCKEMCIWWYWMEDCNIKRASPSSTDTSSDTTVWHDTILHTLANLWGAAQRRRHNCSTHQTCKFYWINIGVSIRKWSRWSLN